MSNIKFGTDGWRAITDKDFNEENVKRVSFAIAKYVSDNFGTDKKILIGYDPRRKAESFAKISADVFKNVGFQVFLSEKVVATPVLAYSAKIKNACAIMFTASHNPPEYLGMKFIPEYAGPATDEITSEIVQNLDMPVSKNTTGNIQEVSFDEDYISHIEKIVNMEKIAKENIEINYDALHGAAGNIFTTILKKYNIKFEATNLNYDTNFGGKLPEPAEKFLGELKEQCKKTSKIGLSNDGDGDRFALIDENGKFVTANEVIAILLKHLKINKHYEGKLAKTVAGSLMLELFASKYGIDVVETPVGFKWVGKAMRENDIIIGGEESGGLSIKGHIPEKDGILANLLIAESIAYNKKTITELRNEITAEIGFSFINKRIDLKLADETIVKEAFSALENIQEIDSFSVIRKNYADGIKMYLNDNVTGILVRKSGTEPLLRIYFESDNSEKIEKLIKAINNLIVK